MMEPWVPGALIAAPFIGSFLGTLVLRLPEGRPVLAGRSACPACGTRLGPRDLVPLLSWAILRGRCRQCGTLVPAFYPAIELAALGVAIWAATVVGGVALLASCLLGWGLLALALIDRRHFLLPDALTLPLLATGLGATALLDPPSLPAHAIGAAGGYLAFAGIAALYRQVRRRDGLGLGDAKLLAAGGAWLGWSALPSVVLLAALLGILEVLAARLGGGAPLAATRPIAFGTWLAAAIWLVWLYGPPLPG
jgi:leader peptidase (prepilin peptidase)/N-methyltransferase